MRFRLTIGDTNHELGKLDDPLCLTGVVYKLAPALKLASRPIGQWNLFEIEVKGHLITVRLNSHLVCSYRGEPTRRTEGYIGLQNHDPASQVQFRPLFVKKLEWDSDFRSTGVYIDFPLGGSHDPAMASSEYSKEVIVAGCKVQIARS